MKSNCGKSLKAISHRAKCDTTLSTLLDVTLHNDIQARSFDKLKSFVVKFNYVDVCVCVCEWVCFLRDVCMYVCVLCGWRMLIEMKNKRRKHWQNVSNVPAPIHAYQQASDYRVFPVWAHRAMQLRHLPYCSIMTGYLTVCHKRGRVVYVIISI